MYKYDMNSSCSRGDYMDKKDNEKNIEKLISIYNSIPDSNKEAFLKAVKYLSECFDWV